MSFRLFNQNGLLAFSSEHNNMRFLERRTISRANNAYEVTISSAIGAPLIFVRPAGSEMLACYLHAVAGSSYTFRVLASGGASAPASLDVYIFVPDMIQATGYGINVRKSDGGIAFSTASRLLKIAGHYLPQAETPAGTSGAAQYSLASGSVPSQYAICAQSHGFAFLPIQAINSTLLNILGARVNSSQMLERGVVQTMTQFGGLRDGVDFHGPLYVPLIDRTLYD